MESPTGGLCGVPYYALKLKRCQHCVSIQ